MIALKSEDMRKIDQDAIQKFGIPGIVLMENAAKAFVDEFLKDITPKEVVIVCGLGNNGGDGLAIGRMLHVKGITVRLVLVGSGEQMKGDARINYEIITRLNLPIFQVLSEEDLKKLYAEPDYQGIFIDALFGTGCQKTVEDIHARTIEWMNLKAQRIYSVDMPSGIHADNGKIMGICVKAYRTITFCLPKIGLFLYPGALFTGTVVVVDIGIPREVWKDHAYTYEILDDSYMSLLPYRKTVSHKGSYGKVLIVAGSKNMLGAAILSATAALRTGCGIVKIMTEEGNEQALFTALPEAIITTYKKTPEALGETLALLDEAMNWADAILMGPGMGNDATTLSLVSAAMKREDKPLVLDADALNALSDHLALLDSRVNPVIITPHLGEMERLCGYHASAIQEATVEFAFAFSKSYPVITILKSARTIITDGEYVYINIAGNSGMATAGSGDVLAGIIASLLGQKLTLLSAGVFGVFLHSKAGDMAKLKRGEHGLIAGDIIESISDVMKDAGKEY